MRAPYGPLRIVRDWKHRMFSHTGTKGACEYPCDQSCGKCKHGLYIPGQTFDLYGDPYGSRAGHTRLSMGVIRGQNCRKPVSENCVRSTVSYGLYGARSQQTVRTHTARGSQVLAFTELLNSSGATCDVGKCRVHF